MGNYITLKTNDNHEFQAYLSEPKTKILGCVVIVQEIFGVNQHIKEICKTYSEKGYIAIAPSLFDRLDKNIDLPYDQTGIQEGRKLKDLFNDTALNEIESSISYMKVYGKVGIIGFCWGGSLAWRIACQNNNLSASVIYYGGDVPKLKNLSTKCPTICHFGEIDKSIPINDVNSFISLQKDIEVYTYPADHGFNCNHRSQYDKNSSKLAFERTITFLKKNLL